MNLVEQVGFPFIKKIPSFKAGDTVKVHLKIKEGDRERIQVFEGIVIKIHRHGVSSSFTVRKISYGVGVERIFPLYSPIIKKIEVASVGDVRRAKLYYLRALKGKKARIMGEDQEGVASEEVESSTEKTTPPESKRAKQSREESLKPRAAIKPESVKESHGAPDRAPAKAAKG